MNLEPGAVSIMRRSGLSKHSTEPNVQFKLILAVSKKFENGAARASGQHASFCRYREHARWVDGPYAPLSGSAHHQDETVTVLDVAVP